MSKFAADEIEKCVGLRIGERTILSPAPDRFYTLENGNKMRQSFVRVQCSCGRIDEVVWSAFKRGALRCCKNCWQQNLIARNKGSNQ